MSIFFKNVSPYHGEQFCTVSGSMRRLTLLLINLVKTLEITTKQLENIILHILKQKQIRKNTKTQVFLLLHFCTINSRNVTSLCHAKSHSEKKYCSKLLVNPYSGLSSEIQTVYGRVTSTEHRQHGGRCLFREKDYKPFILSVFPHVTRRLLSTHFSRILH